MGATGAVPGACSVSAPTQKPGPASQDRAQATAVGANSTWAMTVTTVSVVPARRSSWMPRTCSQEACSDTPTATAPTRARTPSTTRAWRSPSHTQAARPVHAGASEVWLTTAHRAASAGTSRAPGTAWSRDTCPAVAPTSASAVTAKVGTAIHWAAGGYPRPPSNSTRSRTTTSTVIRVGTAHRVVPPTWTGAASVAPQRSPPTAVASAQVALPSHGLPDTDR